MKAVFYVFVFIHGFTSYAQILTLDKCLSGSGDDRYYLTHKFTESDSIRYFVIESNSENYIFDSINRDIYNGISMDMWYHYLVRMNENTREVKTLYMHYLNFPNILNEHFVGSYSFREQPDTLDRYYIFKIGKQLDSLSPVMLYDSLSIYNPGFNVNNTFFAQDGPVCWLYVYYVSFSGTQKKIMRYKFDNMSMTSSQEITSLRIGPGISFYPPFIYNGRMYEYYNGTLNVLDLDANLLASHTLYNSSTASTIDFVELSDSALLFYARDDSSLTFGKINSDNAIEYSNHLPNSYDSLGRNRYIFEWRSASLIDSNLLFPFYSPDSLYRIRFDKGGNVINRYAEALDYDPDFLYSHAGAISIKLNDSTKIIVISKSNYRPAVFMEQITTNGIPVVSTQLDTLINFNGHFSVLRYISGIIKTNSNRYFIKAWYEIFGQPAISVIYEYTPDSGKLTRLLTSDSEVYQDIFSDDANDIFVVADVYNDGCVDGADVVIYKLSDVINSTDSKMKDQKIFLYPNPAHDVLHVDRVSSLSKNGKALISDIAENIVFIKDIRDDIFSININFLSPGIYFLVFEEQNNRTVSKFVVQR